MNQAIRSLIILLCFLSAPVVGRADQCDALDYQLPQPKPNLYTLEQDIELGKESFSGLRFELSARDGRATRVIDDKLINDYLQILASRILEHAPEFARKFGYSFYLYDNSAAGADALAGGIILVSLGVLIEAPSDDALAFMIAHEIGHIALRHYSRDMTLAEMNRIANAIISEMLFSPNLIPPTEAELKALEMFQEGLRFHPEYPHATVLVHETEADIFSAMVATGAGFKTGNVVKFHRGFPVSRGRVRGWIDWTKHPNKLVRALIYECAPQQNSFSAREVVSPTLKKVKKRARELLSDTK